MEFICLEKDFELESASFLPGATSVSRLFLNFCCSSGLSGGFFTGLLEHPDNKELQCR